MGANGYFKKGGRAKASFINALVLPVASLRTHIIGYPLISWHRYGKLPIYVHIYIYITYQKKRWFSVAIRWNFRPPYCWGPTWREMGRRHHEVFALGWGNGWGLLRNHQKAVQSTGNCWGTTSFTVLHVFFFKGSHVIKCFRSCFESGKSVVDIPQFFGSSETDLGPDDFSILGLWRYDDIL